MVLQTYDVILLPAIGTDEDQQALEQMENYYPAYSGRIIPVDTSSLVINEGGLNCISWTTLEP